MKKSGEKQDDKQNNGIVSFRLNALASSIFAIMAPILPAVMPRLVINRGPNYFDRLPEKIIRHVIASYLNPADKLNLALLYKENLRIMKPELRLSNFLHCVARGQQDEAERLLNTPRKEDDPHPNLLLERSTFTDYSGRTFECTAYEYAYWAKDTHMCRMLERHMDENTKAAMLVKVTAIDTVGLTYEQHGHVVEHSKHFDMTPLKTALQNYVNGYDAWAEARDYDAMEAAWMQVGKAQRDLPVHVIHEYCRPDRSFYPLPAFNEDKLPRILTYYNFNTGSDGSLFPLVVSGPSGLGVDFALFRGWTSPIWAARVGARRGGAVLDLAAVSRLDEVRAGDLTRSRENLLPVAPEHDLGMSL